MRVDAIEAQLPTNDALQAAWQAAVLRPATATALTDPASVWVPTPKPARVKEAPAGYATSFSPAKRDYLAQEARNRSLGRAGELFIVELEARRLHAAGKQILADRGVPVAASHGDGTGFSVRSFPNSASDSLFYVKTTTFGPITPLTVKR